MQVWGVDPPARRATPRERPEKSQRKGRVGDGGGTYLRMIALARAVGIGVQQVRNYEAGGFLSADGRSPSG